MKCPFIFLGLLLLTPALASANALQTPDELREKGFAERRQKKARENMKQRMKAKEVIENEKQEQRNNQEKESLEREAREESEGQQGPRYIP